MNIDDVTVWQLVRLLVKLGIAFVIVYGLLIVALVVFVVFLGGLAI